MGTIGRFWGQPCSRYRDFQIAFTILTLNFAIPSISYALFPQVAIDQFVKLNALLGGAPYLFPEAGSRFWRYLGTANVMALAFMCFLLQWNLRVFRPVLVPLTFLKATAATLWLAGWIAAPELRGCLAAAVLDYVTSAAFVFFAARAYTQIAGRPDADLVPRPAGSARG